ncbi:uncharacterized protein LOC122050304 [Zingiber officinale]|uniref:uncharacterized protein LOC122050304 n=1 Tax=Zingiber officinale TaxID=94328 RepID=UPI001C4B256C|nr:uncharacterized protein LOC122050304 [Zingiber officinale]
MPVWVHRKDYARYGCIEDVHKAIRSCINLSMMWRDPPSCTLIFVEVVALNLSETIRLVRKLSIPDTTKQFVLALHEPDSDAVVYILAAQNLSLQSAFDAEDLIKEVKPKTVVAQISLSALADIQAEEKDVRNDQANLVPTSSIGVLKRCFIEKISKDHYENFAGRQVLQEIFGVGCYGHFLSAKRAAEEIGSDFMLLESPYDGNEGGHATTCSDNNKDGGQTLGLRIQAINLLPPKVTSVTYFNSKRLCLDDAIKEQMVKMVIPFLELAISKGGQPDSNFEEGSVKDQPKLDYKVPAFAQSFYPLFADLHDIFIDLPSIEKAVVAVQRMLVDINEGKPVNTHTLSNAYIFRIAVESLRIALNDAARCPMERTNKVNPSELEYFELPLEEKAHVLFVHTLRNQAKKFGSIVAIVDTSCLAGLRKHWNTSVPPKVAESINLGSTECYEDDLEHEKVIENMKRNGLLVDKPVVAVSAGATVVLGASSLSKAVPMSTLIKFSMYKIPATLKLSLTQLQRIAIMSLSKFFAVNPFAQVLASAGAKTSAMKVTTSAVKIRSVAHTMIAAAEKTSLLAMRTSFYEIMRSRSVRPIRFAPLAMFGCSMAACTGLLTYGDGIECAAESLPSVPMIASLGRGLQSLHQASMEVRQTNGTKMQEALQSLVHNLKKMRRQ